MLYICDLYDNQLEKEYKLYKINAKEISKRLFKQYKLSQVKLQVFNSESQLARNITDIRRLQWHGMKVKDDDFRATSIRKTIKEILDNKHISSITNIGVNMGYEIMPVAISVQDFDIENPNSKLELIDGFKRMFCTTEVPDIDILVKVYDYFDDRDWINSMILYNSWKFTNSESSHKYMDRGFQLGLYYRYNLMFINMIVPNRNILNYIDIYTKGYGSPNFWDNGGNNIGTYITLWNNNQFHNDLVSIYNMLIYNPTFIIKKKNKPDEIYTENIFYNNMEKIYEDFIYFLGVIRRYEYTNKIVDRKPFNINILINFFNREDLQKDFVKVQNMRVGGFIENYIRDHLEEKIKETMFNAFGYPIPEKSKNRW